MKEPLLYRIQDGGPIYQEPLVDGLFLEPWNAWSSLLFWLPVFWLIWRHRKVGSVGPFLLYFCAPLLFVGGLGSALYHGLRSTPFFLYLDVMPILLLCLGLGWFLWKQLLGLYWAWLALLLFLAASVLARLLVSGTPGINLNYFLRGVFMFLPALLCLQRMAWRHSPWLLAAVALFGMALWFRVIDRDFSWLPMGTHFLWHVCCGIGALFLGKFLVRLRKGIALKVYAG